MDITLVLKQMIILFILMIVGYLANKKKIMNTESDKLFSKLIVNITCPALIIYSVVSGEHLKDNKIIIYIFIVAILYYILIPIIAKLLIIIFRIKKNVVTLYESILIYSNIGFMGIPVVSIIFGKNAVLYISIFMSIFNISIFTYGIFLFGKDLNVVKSKKSFINIKNFYNPGITSAVMAIAIYLMNISIPEVILEPIRMVGNITTPLAMLVIGSTLANFSIRNSIKEKWIYIFIIIKLLILPIIVWFVSRFFISDKLLLGILVIVSGMPVASNVVMMSNEYGGDQNFITKGVFFSTLFSVVTIPIIAVLF
ncbi:AEC family transporter [Clostridium fungisolvens]|uniref:Transporter n=1 Tax=Clostridium fungisolvens TaxID=1604897 RepID=A0A6V8SB01_9CLOT|nr:AEC family transporter [Clostridium fungisolvens]GFP74417.1 hypothetical protein bsdtw1_00467 [Clostridium fungisolvens]